MSIDIKKDKRNIYIKRNQGGGGGNYMSIQEEEK